MLQEVTVERKIGSTAWKRQIGTVPGMLHVEPHAGCNWDLMVWIWIVQRTQDKGKRIKMPL